MAREQENQRGGHHDQGNDLGRWNGRDGPGVGPKNLHPQTPDGVIEEIRGSDIAVAQTRSKAPRQPKQEQEAKQVPQRLVQKGGMKLRLERILVQINIGAKAVQTVNGNAPGQRGGRAVQFLVDVIAPAANGLRQQNAGRDDVGPTPSSA